MTFPKQRFSQDVDYAIGTSASVLNYLRMMQTPVPDQVTFLPASTYYMRGDGTRVGDGYSSCQWIWDVISIQRLSVLLRYLSGADYASVYIRTDVRDGTYPNPRSAFKVYSAIMLKPIIGGGQEGVPLARSPYNMQTVSITFKNLVEQV